METLDTLCALLPETASQALRREWSGLREVRLRAGQPVQLKTPGGVRAYGDAVSPQRLNAIAMALMRHSVYAREDELRQGYFTLEDGCRVGVCGRLACDNGRVTGMTAIGAMCVRRSRAVHGCADALYRAVAAGGHARSLLILSPPGMGKTTCLRELARRLSCEGLCVAIADERHEIAACRDGVPTLDVGPCADVMDGGPKHIAIGLMLRTMSPDVIVADEIGSSEDAAALAEAARCGAAVISSAHARDIGDASRRPSLAAVMRGGVFSVIAVLGGAPGRVREIVDLTNGEDANALCAGNVYRGGLRAVREIHGRGLAAKGAPAGGAPAGDTPAATAHDQHV